MERRRPGRPPLDDEDESTSVHLRLPARTYDELYQRARRGESVQDVIRRDLARRSSPQLHE